MRSTFISSLLLLLLCLQSAFAQPLERYGMVRIYTPTQEVIRQISALGIALDHVGRDTVCRIPTDICLDVIVNEKEISALRSKNIRFDVLIEDMYRYYDGQPKLSKSDQKQIQSVSTVKGFGFGSMGGYYTYDEVVAQLDSMYIYFPNLITPKVSIGKSIEGRDIWMVKISHYLAENGENPEVLFTALHHAREPEGMMVVLYFMYYLLERYDKDAEVTYLLDHRALYFIPVVNPDGYAYNQKIRPDGGGLWRKSRRLNPDSSYGVDLNRNYSYKWGYDNIGSSPAPGAETYRGAGPFSEPETQAVRDFCLQHHFQLALNYHTYGNYLIYPFGYNSQVTPDDSIFRRYASDMAHYNRYTYGTNMQTVHYAANGDADDWMYGEQTTKDKIIAMTPEVGSSSDNFWPTMDRIYPLAQENLRPNLYLAWVAGAYLCIESIASKRIFPSDTVKVVLNLRNKGLKATSGILVKVSTADTYAKVLMPEINITNIPSFSTWNNQVTPIPIVLSCKMPSGHTIPCTLRIHYNDTELDTTFLLSSTPVQVESPSAQLSASNYRLSQNYPNPFNPITNVEFRIPNSTFVSLKVFDVLGREVATLVNEEKSPGNYRVTLDTRHSPFGVLPSGVYFYRLSAKGFTETKKMLLSK